MNLKKEIPILAIVALPFIYLAYIWKELPETVPMHWNITGEIDRYGDKSELIVIPFLLPLLVYIIFLVVPKIDPKNKLNKMGNKLQIMKFLLTTIMSILALLIIYSARNDSFLNSNYVVLLIGVLFIVSGNYFKTIKPNYFIGIRTPWTLESETAWKETHRLAGKLWFIGGIIVVFSSLIADQKANNMIFLTVTLIISIIPILHSYIVFKKEKKDVIEPHV